MFFLLYFSFSTDIQEVGDYDYQDYIGTNKPALVKFYNPSCPHCFAMADEFWQVTEMFDDVNFVAIDCITHKNLCVNEFNIEKYPSVAIFMPNSLTPIKFEGYMGADEFAKFVKEKTNIEPRKIPKLFYEVTPNNFEAWKDSKKCAVGIFYSSLFEHHKKFLYEARMVAKAFQNEENVTIGIIRCDKFRPLCKPVNDLGYPVAARWTNANYVPFNDMAIANLLVLDINDNCDTHRRIDGFLEENVGRIEAAKPFVKEFIETKDPEERSKIIEKTKEVPGASFYVKVMNRIIKEGDEKIIQTINKMHHMITDPHVNAKNRDFTNKNFNVFKEFYPNYIPPTQNQESNENTANMEQHQSEKSEQKEL
ncbi:Thioredoxin family protein [Trichomonas vaginalis G3]|uniref:Thioredoxin family protein n=1 Tax=Trichomonas vaginalis (strain ATCC PRA-98 / G3) TaxID=412133 RepID=A2FP72_TRIV3|nr:cell redox homeostasis [Trichomonas vaginalis G3]EAX93307.1 Thioredoxin family protein [Trichomonas vaginalis G3]KAI5547481.1 cell redox homeostasis [Trichomonas vaginalis G3]|eukprot:XP_001306237.1 Thioredoxin family protein [Trichomonas vaginalis G3]